MIQEIGLLTPLIDGNHTKYDEGEYADNGCAVAIAYLGKDVKCCDCPFPECIQHEKYSNTFRCRVYKASRIYHLKKRRAEIDKLFSQLDT